MSVHPDDEAYLNTLRFTSPRLRRYCDGCKTRQPTIGVGHIETGSGPGYELRYCRGCIAPFLARARAEAVRGGLVCRPSLPRFG